MNGWLGPLVQDLIGVAALIGATGVVYFTWELLKIAHAAHLRGMARLRRMR